MTIRAQLRAARLRAREAERRADLLASKLALVTLHNEWRATLPVQTDVTLLDVATLDLVTSFESLPS